MTVSLSRKYQFSASHRLHAPQLSDAENRAIYGKCNNPWGHGHNYDLEITVTGPVDAVTGRVVDLAALDQLAETHAVSPFRHGNLNALMSESPTTENFVTEIEQRLKGSWPVEFPPLKKIRIWETDRNICEKGL